MCVPINIDATRATLFFHYSNTCSGIRTTHHAREIGWAVSPPSAMLAFFISRLKSHTDKKKCGCVCIFPSLRTHVFLWFLNSLSLFPFLKKKPAADPTGHGMKRVVLVLLLLAKKSPAFWFSFCGTLHKIFVVLWQLFLMLFILVIAEGL